MKKANIRIDIASISLIMWILTGVIAIVFNTFHIAFYCFCTVLVMNIIYYMYAYKVKYKNQKKNQLESLTSFRTQLFYALILIVVLYVLAFWLEKYNSPFEDLYIFALGVLLIISLFALVVCFWAIWKTRKESLSE